MAYDHKIGTAELLYLSAQKMGLQPHWLTKRGLFTIVTPSGERYVSHAKSSLNSQMNAGLAKNKYHTRIILGRHGLPNIPYGRFKAAAEVEGFLAVHGTIIMKPVGGQGSRDIHIISDSSQLAGRSVKGYIFEKYITGKEMRYLVLNDQIIAVHQSEYGLSVAEDRALVRISHAEGEWDAGLASLSLKTAKTFGLKFIAVDFLVDALERPYILEVNTAPGLKWFHAPTSGPAVDVASLFLQAMLATRQ